MLIRSCLVLFGLVGLGVIAGVIARADAGAECNASVVPVAPSAHFSGFARYQPEPTYDVRQDVAFPRLDRLQYRGTAAAVGQFSIEKVLNAIGGDITPTIGSRLHWLVYGVLTMPEKLEEGPSFLQLAKARFKGKWIRPGVRETMKFHGILADLESLLACGEIYDASAANLLAAELSRKGLRALEENWGGEVNDYLFNYRSSKYLEYGDWRGPISIYSTIYPRLAHAYGDKILIFANSSARSLDLNYWNYLHNDGLWSGHLADRAEYVTAAYIDPQAVRGIWFSIPMKRNAMGRSRRMTDPELSLAIMRMEFRGLTYAAIIDPGGESCVVSAGAGFEGCDGRIVPGWKVEESYSTNDIEFGPVTPNGTRLPLIAVARACADGDGDGDGQCSVPAELFDSFPATLRAVSDEVLTEINRATFSRDGRTYRHKVRFHPGGPAATNSLPLSSLPLSSIPLSSIPL